MITPLKVGYFLASRQLRRYGRGTTALIVVIMTLTFLNLVVVSGILVGLIQGSSAANRWHYSGDVLITTPQNEVDIARTNELQQFIAARPGVRAVSARLLAAGRLEANYRTAVGANRRSDTRGAEIAGIEPSDEDAVSALSRHVIDGRPLDENAFGEVLIGSSLLAEYARTDVPGETLLPNVRPGSKVRLIVGGNSIEVTVRGVVKAKVGNVDGRVFILGRDLRKLMGRLDTNVNEMAIKLDPKVSPEDLKSSLIAAGFGSAGVIQTWTEAQGTFFRELSATFRTLGDIIGSIALAVASLTVFIMIFVNALTRKRYIGIMKGFGICRRSISFAYVLQSIFYSGCGIGLGLAILYGLIKPYFDANPIDFPFSDGILFVPPAAVIWRVAVMFIAAVVAGYVPAQLIIRRNTLDTILGR